MNSETAPKGLPRSRFSVSQHIVGVGHHLLREPDIAPCNGRTGMVEDGRYAYKSVFTSVSGHRINSLAEGLAK